MEFNLILFLILYTSVLLLLIFSGTPIAFGLGLLGVLSIGVFEGWNMTKMIAYEAWNSTTLYSLTAVYPFVLMGAFFANSGLAGKVFSSVSPLMCRLLPGGLLHTNVFGGALFASVSGSSVASTSTLGLISLTEMEKRGYEKKISVGSVLAGGSLGILIPPSITMIIYGAMTDQSIGKLFVAGVIPGILLTIAYTVYISTRLKMNPALAPPREIIPLKTCLRNSLGAWPIFVLIVAVIGSLYLGIATPTEAGAIGCFGGLIIVAGFRMLTWEAIKKSSWDSVRVAAMLTFLFALAKIMGNGLGLLEIPQRLVELAVTLGIGKYSLLGIIILMYVIMGCLMESLSAIVMTLPVTYPLIISAGFDPIWFGIVLVMLDELGMITPPVGMILYVIRALRPDYEFREIARGAIPFCLVVCGVLLILVAFPKLATFLPAKMFVAR